MILTETAGTAGPRRQIHILLVDRLHADAPRLAFQEIDEVAGRERRGAALADVRHLAPRQEVVLGGHRQDARTVAPVLEDGLDDALGPPVQAAEQDRDSVAFLSREGPGRVRTIVLSGARGHCALHCRWRLSRTGPSTPRAVRRRRTRAGAGWYRPPGGPPRGPRRHRRDIVP